MSVPTPSFERKDIVKIANNLLVLLFDKTEGDEWESVKIDELYPKAVNDESKENNTRLKNNVLQHLISVKDATINDKKTHISITSEGKKHYQTVKKIRKEQRSK